MKNVYYIAPSDQVYGSIIHRFDIDLFPILKYLSVVFSVSFHHQVDLYHKYVGILDNMLNYLSMQYQITKEEKGKTYRLLKTIG